VVGILISMKLRVLRNSLKGAAAFSFFAGLVVGLCAAAYCLVVLVFYPAEVTVRTDIAAALFAAWTLGWLFGPIITGGGDETLRPENFALLPVRPAALAVGLLGAGLAGIAPVVTALAFVGLVAIGASGGAVAAVVGLVAVVLQLVLAVLLSKVLIAVLGTLLGSRRGKDLAVLLAAVAGLAFLPAQYAISYLGPLVVHRASPTLTAVLRGAPSGWGPSAVASAAGGDLLAALGWLAALAVLDGLLVLVWSRLLVRRLTAGPAAVAPRRVVARKRARTRQLLPAGPLGAVIGKELRLWWRDAQRRALLLSSVLIGLVIPVFSLAQGGGLGALWSAPLWIVVFAAMQVGNLYGMDGSGVWQTIVTPGAARADVRGRQWAWLIAVGPVVALAVAVLPAVSGAPQQYPWVLALVPALLGAGAGTVVLASVRCPFPMPAGRNRNPFAANGSYGFANLGVRLGITVMQLAAAVPPLVLMVLGATGVLPAAAWVAVPVGVACGATAAWWWGRAAYRRLAERGPELLTAVRVPVSA
jgi:ABC-2 type transport system permease protein